MIAAKQAAWLSLALICMACSGWYFASPSVVAKLDDHTLSTTADMVINHLTVHQFDTHGRLVNYLKTPLMRHIPANNTHLLQTPNIVIREPNQPAWSISAQQATALHGGQQITFNKQVNVHQGKDEKVQESTFKTEAMTYYPKDKLATTLLDVTYERSGDIVKATGMKAYLSEKRVQLLSQARGTFDARRG